MEEGVSLMEKAQKVLDALNAYKNKMIDASQLRRAINQRFSSELRALRAEKDRVDSFESEELPRSMNNMFYYSLRTGNATAYGAKHLFLSDQISAAHLHRNRHYQWVLAEAYEGFEDFLESIYAAVGFADPDFWVPSEFKPAWNVDPATQNYEWHVEQVKYKKNKPRSILVSFRNAFKELRDIEVSNKCAIHAPFEISLISKLRHLIVHNAGRVENKDEVIRRALTEAAVNDKDKDALTARAGMFFNRLKDSKEELVFLVGHENPHFSFISTYNLEDLLGFLVSYAQELTEICMKHLYPQRYP